MEQEGEKASDWKREGAEENEGGGGVGVAGPGCR